jgi:hypothetical protein
MPGIFKKIKSLLKLVSDNAPFLNYVVPGLGTAISVGAKGLSNVGEGINQIHTDYKKAKENKKKFTFVDGLRSGIRGFTSAQEADPVKLDDLTKPLGELSDRIMLKTKT